MFDDDFLQSLPDDADEALATLFQKLSSDLARWRQDEAENQYSTFNLIEEQHGLLIRVFAFIDAHQIDLDLDREAPTGGEAFDIYYRHSISAIEYYIARTSFERSARRKVVASYVLSPALRLEIQRHLEQIRVIIAEADLTENKRDALSKKLNAFSEEVDRDRTRIDALASAIVWTRKEIIAGAQGLEPIVEKLTKMLDSFAKATEFLRLPSGEKKQLPAPPKRIEGLKRNFARDLDDEVPF